MSSKAIGAACAACVMALGIAASPASAGGLYLWTPVSNAGPIHNDAISDPCKPLGYPSISGPVTVCEQDGSATTVVSAGGFAVVYYP